MPDPQQPEPPIRQDTKSADATVPQPSESEVVQAIVEIEEASKHVSRGEPPVAPATRRSWFSQHAFAIAYLTLVLAACVALGWVGQRIIKSALAFVSSQSQKSASRTESPRRISRPPDPTLQAQAETLLRRLASGDTAAPDLILSQSDQWTGKTQRTQSTDQLVTTAFNLPNMHAREAAIQSQLALDGIRQDQSGLELLKQAVGHPNLRPWALWSLGALGNRGVDPVHTAKIIESYLNDPDVNARAGAVDGLALPATDETVPRLLDRFRNAPSPVVQEHAACGMAESGMYTHVQRMRAAATLVNWLNDPLLTPQQRTWAFQALHDITGASLGSDPAAWRQWWGQHGRG